MTKWIKEILNLEQNDRTIFFLIITTTGNLMIAIVKFIFAFTIPSLWFFVNANFLIVLSISRVFSIKNYAIQKNTINKEKRKEIGYKNYWFFRKFGYELKNRLKCDLTF